MARDYAPRNRAPAKKKKAGLPGWIWLFSGLALGLAAAAVMYITRPAEPMQLIPEVVAPPAARADTEEEPVTVPPSEDPRFTFYKMLTDQEVTVPDGDEPTASEPLPPPAASVSDAKPEVQAPAPREPADTQAYLVQVASFSNPADAEAQRARLALLGLEARVEQATIGNKETVYRVRIGPQQGLEQARSVVAQLQSHGLQGLVMKAN